MTYWAVMGNTQRQNTYSIYAALEIGECGFSLPKIVVFFILPLMLCAILEVKVWGNVRLGKMMGGEAREEKVERKFGGESALSFTKEEGKLVVNIWCV